MSTQYDDPAGYAARSARPVNDDARSVGELLSDIVTELSTLFRKEVQLARAEMTEKASHAAGSEPAMAGGGALAFGGLLLLLMAAAAGVSDYFELHPAWGLLIVGAVAALAGYLLIRTGVSRLTSTDLTPHRTAEQLSRDAQAAKEQVR